jgi:hypothetical protein
MKPVTAAQRRHINCREWVIGPNDPLAFLCPIYHRYRCLKVCKCTQLLFFTMMLKLDSLSWGKVNTEWRLAFLTTVTKKINHPLGYDTMQSGINLQNFRETYSSTKKIKAESSPRSEYSYIRLPCSTCHNGNLYRLKTWESKLLRNIFGPKMGR